MPQRPLGPRLSLAADTSRGLPGVFPLEVGWVGQASKPHFERLVYQSSTSYQAKMAGMAYSGHRKVAVGSDGGPRIGRGPTERHVHTGVHRVVDSGVALLTLNAVQL